MIEPHPAPFVLPLRIVEMPGGYCLVDASGLRVAYVYGEDEPGRRNATGQPDRATALSIIRFIARASSDSAEAIGKHPT